MKKSAKIFMATAIVAIIAVVLFFATKNQKTCEFMTTHIYKNYSFVMSKMTAVFPFSVFELLACILVVVFITLLILMIVDLKRKNKQAALIKIGSILLVVSIIVCSYVSLAGFMYNRAKAPIQMQEELLEKDVVKTYAEQYLFNFNELARLQEVDPNNLTVTNMDEEQLFSLLQQEFFEYFKDKFFIKSDAKIKPIISSYLMSAFSISGITYIPTVEPCINKDAPLLDRIFAAAHELAHTTGVMKENEANLMATAFLINSKQPLFKYAGYINSLYQIKELFILTNHLDFYNNFQFESNIKVDLNYTYNWWTTVNKLKNVGTFFNDLYLKFNGQSAGVNSYNSYAQYDSYYDEDLNQHIYVVKKYSDIQNVIFTSLIEQEK